MVFTRSPMVARWSPSILRSFIQSYVVARSSYDGCRLSYDQSWQIADSRMLVMIWLNNSNQNVTRFDARKLSGQISLLYIN